jgi:hypothetical protein
VARDRAPGRHRRRLTGAGSPRASPGPRLLSLPPASCADSCHRSRPCPRSWLCLWSWLCLRSVPQPYVPFLRPCHECRRAALMFLAGLRPSRAASSASFRTALSSRGQPWPASFARPRKKGAASIPQEGGPERPAGRPGPADGALAQGPVSVSVSVLRWRASGGCRLQPAFSADGPKLRSSGDGLPPRFSAAGLPSAFSVGGPPPRSSGDGLPPSLSAMRPSAWLIRWQASAPVLRGRASAPVLRGRASAPVLRGRASVPVLRGRASVPVLRGRASASALQGLPSAPLLRRLPPPSFS